MPDIVISAVRLGDIPRIHPEDLNNISMIHRITEVENKTEKMQICMEQLIRENCEMKQSFNDNVLQVPSMQMW